VIGLGSGSGVVKIALGSNHACALRADGAVLCWGGNQYGQVGSDTSGGVLPPTVVSGFGPGAGVIAIAAGNEHTCAVKSDQAVYCWGRNTNGALGDGTASNRDVPTLVTSLGAGSGAAGVSAGSGYTCAVRYDGATFCWGYNGFGQLGDGTTTASLVPKLILGPATGAVEVNGLYGHTCARTATRVLCWGSNNTGELGDGTTVDRHFSVPVLTLGAGIDAIATGVGHSCARKSGGKVVCWGRNFAGQLGNGTFVDALTPQVVELNDSIFGDGFE
jgi:alpha-tubulin suppressor-like RCC1 family protein